MRIKSRFTILAIILSSVLATACISDDDLSLYYSGDCAIVNASLGQFYRKVHLTNADGRDTSFVAVYQGSNYAMHIDQQKQEIYNLDSLPINTFVNKSLLSISADGNATIRNLDTDGEKAFSSTDSTDFTRPRFLTVYSTDGTSKKTYKVKINVHKVESEKFTWYNKEQSNNDIQLLTEQRSFVVNEKIYLFGHINNKAVLLTAPISNNLVWTKQELTEATLFSIKSLQRFSGKFYTIIDSKLCVSEDGSTWTALPSEVEINGLIAAGSKTLFGISNEKIYGTTDGISWNEQELDNVAGNLPNTNLSSVAFLSKVNKTVEFILFGGEKDGVSKLWKKENYLTINETTPWNYCPTAEENKFGLPLLSSLSLINYDNLQLALGYNTSGLKDIYVSRDGGLTWKIETSIYSLPQDLTNPTTYSCVVDSENFIWLFCGGTGEVWKGRLNRLGFENNPNTFE